MGTEKVIRLKGQQMKLIRFEIILRSFAFKPEILKLEHQNVTDPKYVMSVRSVFFQIHCCALRKTFFVRKGFSKIE